MVIMFYFLVGIGIIGATITLFSVLHNLDVSEMMPVYKPGKKKVGPTFWGNYQDSVNDVNALSAMQTIKLPKITFNPEAVVGSELYSKGMAVKSAKR
ncbi:MAG: hypothetical protein JST89_25050 [Cyanobacteria bacterium SZAS-4]|nr:hypothetical protein [Cyanobacteria bacterium SZAS-4]